MEDRLKKLEEKVDRLENIIYTLFKASLLKENERRGKKHDKRDRVS